MGHSGMVQQGLDPMQDYPTSLPTPAASFLRHVPYLQLLQKREKKMPDFQLLQLPLSMSLWLVLHHSAQLSTSMWNAMRQQEAEEESEENEAWSAGSEEKEAMRVTSMGLFHPSLTPEVVHR